MICSIKGTGTPFPDSCKEHMLTVSSTLAGGAVARFEPVDVDVTWGFSNTSSSKAWVQVRDGGVLLTGYADLGSERFALKQEVNILPKHVWFKAGAPVLLRGGSAEGVAVMLHGDIAGVSPRAATVDCSLIVYAPAPPPPLALPEPESTLPIRNAKRASLPLHVAPGVPAFTVLSGDDVLTLTLQIVEAKRDWTQVRFDTTFAHFEAWVESSKLSEEGSGFGAGGLGLCGGTSGGGYRASHKVLETSPVIVGLKPRSKAAASVFIGRGAGVAVNARLNGFVSVHVIGSAIHPPDGEHFWIPETVLDPQLPPARVTAKH